MTITRTQLPPDTCSAADIHVRSVATRADMEAVLSIRRQVFKVELRMAGESVEDVDDARSIVALATLDLPASDPQPVGTGRLMLRAGQRGEGVVTWVATARPYRGLGVGEAVMRYLLTAAETAGPAPIILAAQAPAIRFYERLGFVPNGSRYMVSDIDHLPMIHPGSAQMHQR